MSVAIVIPCWNEEKHLLKTLREIKKYSKDWTIILSDDGSTDKSVNIASQEIKHILKNKHQGKGSTARKGCDYAIKKGFKTIVLIDADGQHEPKDISRLLKKLEEKDIVFSYRRYGKQPILLKIGNWGLNMLSWTLFGIHIKDTQSGFRAFTSKAYNQMRWEASQYDMESEMISRAKGLTYAQVPIKIIYHDNQKGTTVKDGLRIGWKMLCWRFEF